MSVSESSSPDSKPADSSSGSKFIRFLKEPLLHFLVAGGVIYVLFGWINQAEPEEIVAENTIVITEGELNWLAETWQKRWNRPPTDEEMFGIVKQHLRETVLYREAMLMGLDKDDTIIRRRLAQKLEFLSQDLIQPEPPTDSELKAYFQKNGDRYRPSELITFTHVFLDPDKRGDQTLDDAEQLKAKFTVDAIVPIESSNLGDTFMLQSYYPERDETDISKLFGGEFAKSIMELKPEQWHGPVLSGYGTHLVYVHALQVFPMPSLDEVANRVRADLENENREQLNDEYIASLLRRYNVVIEGEDSDQFKPGSIEAAQ